jgi:putative sterol carrier protein
MTTEPATTDTPAGADATATAEVPAARNGARPSSGAGATAPRPPRVRAAIARLVARLSDGQLRWLEWALIRWLVIRSVAPALRLLFKPSIAEDVDGVIELRLKRPRGGPPEYIEIDIRGRTCLVRRAPSRWPTATLTITLADMLRIATGAVGVPPVVQAGRVRFSGDVFLIMRFPELFRLPKRPFVQ